MTLRGYLLRGSAPALADALERVHLATDVAGVREAVDCCEVWLREPWPAAVDPATLPQGVTLEALPPPDREWTGRERDAAVMVLPGLLVRPPWVATPAGFRGRELVVPRGGAFGSGEHGSTRATLQVLDALWPARPPESFIDVGTGSGILALYAQQRGVPSLQACDIEPPSVHAAAELLQQDVALGGPETLRGPADIVVANLNGRQLVACRQRLIAHWGRLLILGGMRPAEVPGVTQGLPAPILRREVDNHVALGFAH